MVGHLGQGHAENAGVGDRGGGEADADGGVDPLGWGRSALAATTEPATRRIRRSRSHVWRPLTADTLRAALDGAGDYQLGR